MRKNALDVTDEVVQRLDGAPAFITAFKTSLEDRQFFFNKDHTYVLNKSDKSNSTPGTAYFKKISAFFAEHYVKGELFMEYAKGRCKNTTGSLCEFCKKIPWKSLPFSGIPAPIPDKEKLPKFHYEDVFDTSLLQEDKTPRDVDDFLP
jgi:hypothetical protein